MPSEAAQRAARAAEVRLAEAHNEASSAPLAEAQPSALAQALRPDERQPSSISYPVIGPPAAGQQQPSLSSHGLHDPAGSLGDPGLPLEHEQAAGSAATTSQPQPCPRCTYLNSGNAAECEVCGSALRHKPSASAPASEWRCSFCTYLNAAEDSACQICEHVRQQSDEQHESPVRPADQTHTDRLIDNLPAGKD